MARPPSYPKDQVLVVIPHYRTLQDNLRYTLMEGGATTQYYEGGQNDMAEYASDYVGNWIGLLD